MSGQCCGNYFSAHKVTGYTFSGGHPDLTHPASYLLRPINFSERVNECRYDYLSGRLLRRRATRS